MSLVTMESFGQPVCILLFCGKRKSGKDFITDALHQMLGNASVIVRLSGPIKQHWSRERGVSLDDLLSSGKTKEEHRQAMIDWSQGLRNQDPGYFCRAALDMYKAHEKAVWIVSDARRKSDIAWFKEQYGERVVKFKIIADDKVRTSRGWIFTAGVDDAETECDLDECTEWDAVLYNNGDTEPQELVSSVIRCANAHIPLLAAII